MTRMHLSWKTGVGIVLCAACAVLTGASAPHAQQPPVPPAIASVNVAGVNSGGSSPETHGLNAWLGVWSGSYLVSEPRGTSTLRITVDVNDGGQMVFSYWLQTFDTGEYDWANISLETPTGVISIARHVGGAGHWTPPCCTYRSRNSVNVARSLDRWKHQQVTLVVELINDGFGDQTQLNIVNLSFGGCGIPWPSELTDPEAIDMENGNELRIDQLSQPMLDALACLRTAIRDAGGSFDLNSTYIGSAYRNSQYQAHLREVWDSWLQVQRAGPVCDDLRAYLQQEVRGHHLEVQPAGRSGPHTQRIAVDINLLNVGFGNRDAAEARITELGAPCDLIHRLPRDHPHFELRQPQ